MQHLKGSGMPVLYIGRTVFKGERSARNYVLQSKCTVAHHSLLQNELFGIISRKVPENSKNV
jgi:hypothetical protein